MKNYNGKMTAYAALVATFLALIIYTVAKQNLVQAITLVSIFLFFFTTFLWQKITKIERNLRALMKQEEKKEEISNKA